MKKILALTLALIMVLSVFAGCNTSKSNGPISTEATAGQDETLSWEEKFGEHVTLTWCFPDALGAADFTEWDRIVAAINKITEKEINATINIEVIPLGEYTDKMNMKYNANEPWDICFSGLWNGYANAVSQGVFVELPMDFMRTYAAETLAILNPIAFEALTIDGKLYAMPIQQIYVRQSGVRFEVPWAEEVNFDYTQVKKMEDLEPYFDKLLAAGYTECFFSTGESMMNNLQSYLELDYLVDYLTPGAVNVYDESCTVINQYESQQFKDLAHLMYKWYNKGYFTSAALTGDQDNGGFEEDRHPVDLNPAVKPGGDAQSSLQYDIEIKSIPLGEAVMTTSAINATTMAISTNCKHPGRAMAFINLLNTNEELLNLIVHGEEGVDWNWVDKENKLIALEEIRYPGSYSFLIGNVFNDYYIDETQVGTWDETAEINANAKVSVILGFTFDARPVAGELANISALLKEHVDPILNGMAGPPDEAIAALNEALYQAGLQIVLDEMQSQIDAWKASK